MCDDILGIDFGTSNSAATYLVEGQPKLVSFADGQPTLPTAFFFDFETRETLIGAPATQAVLDGLEGRFMRALKRVLGTSLMHEPRQILNERVTFVDIIARFLRRLKEQAETESGRVFDTVISGRPVVFHGVGDAREQQAEDDLRACYLKAGFKEVRFVYEPAAAALATGAQTLAGQYGLIVDIGGGTSDFSVFEAQGPVRVIANHGVRIGGTDFDRAISIDRVMTLLGKGSALRNAIGPGTTLTPNAIFNDLATWEKIPFLYTAQMRRQVKEMHKLAVEPQKLARLDEVFTHELGHDLAFAVEAGKIAANSGQDDARIDLREIEKGLFATLEEGAMSAILAPDMKLLHLGALETLGIAGLAPENVAQVVYVGGSSLLDGVVQTMKGLFPEARHDMSEVFTAVADGLALSAKG